MTTTNFEEIKEEILKRAHKAGACAEQYGRAYQSKSTEELMQVVKDNFHWACDYNVITPDLIERYREEFAANEIYLNVSTKRGYLLCDNATVEAWGNATVEACDNATVKAWGNATVKACDNATVKACDNATVEACDNATVKACDNATVKAWGNATVEAWGNATVKAWGNATVKACDNATVKAWGNSYCCSYYVIECKLSDKAIYRVISENTIYFADDTIKFKKQ